MLDIPLQVNLGGDNAVVSHQNIFSMGKFVNMETTPEYWESAFPTIL